MALEQHQAQRAQHRCTHHRDAGGDRDQGLRVLQAVDRARDEQHDRADDQCGLRQAAERLGFAVAKAVVVIGRLERPAHGEQRHQ